MLEEPTTIKPFDNYVLLEYEFIYGSDFDENDHGRYELIEVYGPYLGELLLEAMQRLHKDHPIQKLVIHAITKP